MSNSAPTVGLVVRDARAGDLTAAAQLLAETWHHTYDSLYGAEKVAAINAERHGPEALAQRIGVPETAFLVAEQGGALAGVAFAQQDQGAVKLHQLYVAPMAQGAGIGGALLAAISQRFGDAMRMVLEVDPGNGGAIGFYERAGFVAIGKTGACAGIDGIAAIVMERVKTSG